MSFLNTILNQSQGEMRRDMGVNLWRNRVSLL